MIRRAIIVAAVLAAGAGSSHAQWVVRTPKPTGHSLEAVAFTSPDHGFVGGGDLSLIETRDGGRTWTQRKHEYGFPGFSRIEFPDAMHGYACSTGRDSFRTENGGATWIPMAMPDGSVNGMDFLTPTRGFVGYNGGMAFTGDGGKTWELRSDYLACPVVYGMDYRDESVGLVCGGMAGSSDAGIFRSTDGGRTWMLVHSGIANDVIWLDTDSAYSVGGYDGLRSDDDGRTWFVAAPRGLAQGAASIDRAGATDTLGAVSLGGDIWISRDLGETWVQKVVGIGVLPAIWDIHFSDAMHGWVVGSGGLTYKTVDGGETWELINNGCGDGIMRFEFLNEDFGVAVTENSYIFVTRDGGKRWDVTHVKETGLVFGRDEGLNDVQIVDENTVVVAGDGSIVFRSIDGARTWESIGWPTDLPEYFDMEAVWFQDADNGWIGGTEYGSTRSLWRTRNGGASWSHVPEVRGSISSIMFRGKLGWISTYTDTVWRTTDGGDTWSQVQAATDITSLNDVEFADDLHGYAAGWYGGLSKTSDGGKTWKWFDRGVNEIYHDIDVVSPDEAWIIGDDRESFDYFVLHTTDGGGVWKRTNLTWMEYEEWYWRIEVQKPGRVWLGGWGGTLITEDAPCDPDCNGDGVLNINDYICFQTEWRKRSAYGDYDKNGVWNVNDYIAFQADWRAGCP